MKQIINQNVYVDNNQQIKVVGYKTFRGIVSLFKKINKDCNKKGIKLNFTIQLPMKY